jgi:hypothetical protein
MEETSKNGNITNRLVDVQDRAEKSKVSVDQESTSVSADTNFDRLSSAAI